ncbi:hypothetical protein [Bdellovibrio sp. HCB209]|uniref:hypothetical protein n=1 Tax=Bdellovibrio sp. HCB209 TaxID=3394354 RepID=UPI0039B59C4E
MRLQIICLAVLSFSAVVSHAQSMPGLIGFGAGFQIQKDTVTVVENMPPVLTQDSLGLCYSYAATTVMQAANCRVQKQDCKKLTEQEMFSPLDVARFGQKEDGEKDYESSYRGIAEGGPGGYTLERASVFVGSAASEACMSLDKILSKLDGAQAYATDAQLAAFNRLRKLYEKSKGIDKNCPSCLADFYATAKTEIDKDFTTNKDQAAVLKAFSEETYDKFFDRLITPKECARAKNRVYYEGKDSTEIAIFPKEKKDLSQKAVMNKLKSLFKQQTPALLEGICLDAKMPKSIKNCDASHALALTGYARLCDSGGNCYDALKVQSSWGKSWQKAISKDISEGIRKTMGKNDDDDIGDGWIAADDLFKHTVMQKGMLTWLQDKPAKPAK